MINHARTLLLNRPSRANHITADTAAEYVPTNFVPVKLNTELSLVRRVLFGSKPDARFINLRIRELLNYVHQSEAEHYVYDLDPRVTYWPTQTEDFAEAARSQITVTQLYGPPQKLTIVGEFQPNHSIGLSMHQYVVSAGRNTETMPMTAMRLEAENPTTLSIAVQELQSTKPPEIFNAGTVGSTDVAVLPQTQLKLLTNFAEAPSPYGVLTDEDDNYLFYEASAAGGRVESEQLASAMALLSSAFDEVLAQWFVSVKAVPKPIVTTLLPTLELLGEPVFLALFGVTDKEPYLTFKNLWFDHYAPAYRLAGLTLALIYRTEELRRNKNAN